MHPTPSHPARASGFAVTLLASALLAACGGGGSDTSTGADAIDDPTAISYAANATQIGSDTMSVADGAVLAAQAMVTAGAGVSSNAQAAASDSADATSSTTSATLASSVKACPGGGTATVSITGGTALGQLNGKLDTGEVYGIVYAACIGAGGVGRLDGAMTMTVDSATGDAANGTLALSMAATGLTLALPNGGASLDGTTARQVTVATSSDGTVHLTSRFVSPSLTLATHYRARASSFTLSAADITRTATLAGGVLQSSTISGTHTLTAVLPNASFAYTVATIGGATSYSADGRPTAGAWTVTLPKSSLAVTVANGTATIAIDIGKDGTVDRTITVPIATLVGDAG